MILIKDLSEVSASFLGFFSRLFFTHKKKRIKENEKLIQTIPTIISITSVLKIERTGHQIIIKMGLEFMEKYAKMCVIHILPFILTNKHLSVCCKENSWSVCQITSGGNCFIKKMRGRKTWRKIFLFLVTTDNPYPSSDLCVLV